MNKLESCLIANPESVDDECAKFLIDDPESPFILSEIMTVGTQYTFSFWIKSENDTSIQVCGNIFESYTDWHNHRMVFESTDKDLTISFLNAGVYYIYHPKLETGNMVTDWSPAPEDMASAQDVIELDDNIVAITESFSEFVNKADEIYATVSTVETKIKDSTDNINKDVVEIKSQVESRMTNDNIITEITTRINDGVTKVDTKTGFVFDSNGMTVDKTGAKTKTLISENGMTVYEKKDDNATEVLTANDDGVYAKNLHATTYLKVGGLSRFEKYDTNRIGCFWIGG